MRFAHRPGFTRFAQAQPHIMHHNRLEEGTDRQMDTTSALVQPRQRRRCGGKKAEARTTRHPGAAAGRAPGTPKCHVGAPSPVLTYFCFSASFLCSKASAKRALLSTPGSVVSAAASPDPGDVPSLCSAGGTRFRLLRGGHGGQRQGLSPETPPPHPAGAQGLALGVPLVPRSSRCFFQGRPSSFRGGFSGSRRWSCCRRSSRLRAASSTGAGSAGNRAGGQGQRTATTVPIPPSWPWGRGCHSLCPRIPRAAAICSLLTNRGRALACHPRCHPMCHHVPPHATECHPMPPCVTPCSTSPPQSPQGTERHQGRIRASRPQTRWHPRPQWPRSPQFGRRQWQFVPR